MISHSPFGDDIRCNSQPNFIFLQKIFLKLCISYFHCLHSLYSWGRSETSIWVQEFWTGNLLSTVISTYRNFHINIPLPISNHLSTLEKILVFFHIYICMYACAYTPSRVPSTYVFNKCWPNSSWCLLVIFPSLC